VRNATIRMAAAIEVAAITIAEAEADVAAHAVAAVIRVEDTK